MPLFILIINILLYISMLFLSMKYNIISEQERSFAQSFIFFLFSILFSMANNGKETNSNCSYSLHHYDHPRMIFDSKPLDGDNFLTWHRVMVISLNAKSNWILLMELSRHPLQKSNQKNMQYGRNATTWYYLESLIL